MSTDPRTNLNTAIEELQTLTTSSKIYLKAADAHYIEITVGAGPGYALIPVDRGTGVPTDGIVVVPT